MPDVRETFFFFHFFVDNFTGSKDIEPYKTDVSFLCQYILVEITIQKEKFVLANVYGPNEDKPQFYRNLKQKIEEFNTEWVIICGEVNLVLDPNMDTQNYKTIN